MKGIFVAGTDTDVGKTIVSGCLAKYFLEKGLKVITQKWIQTGEVSNFSSDIILQLKIMGKKKQEIKDYLPLVCPYRFRIASSPHLASRVEKKKINLNRIIKSFKLLSNKFDLVIVEGIGGILVPFDKKHLVIDLVRTLNLSVLVVAQNKLGAINHTLLTIEALRKRKIKILGLVFNNLQNEDERILRDNPLIIKKFSKQPIFGVLPWVETYDAVRQPRVMLNSVQHLGLSSVGEEIPKRVRNDKKHNYRTSTYDKLYEKFIPIGNRIWQTLCR